MEVTFPEEAGSRPGSADGPDAGASPAGRASGPVAPGPAVVVKIGSSSVAAADGLVHTAALDALSAEIAVLRSEGYRVVIVTSGAIAVGWRSLASKGGRPTDSVTLQAVAALGQHRLMRHWDDALGARQMAAGQVLMAPLDFVHRRQYLHVRRTLERLLELGIVPVVNENDAVADEEIRFGDNDRLAALVSHLVRARLLVVLTDTPGLYTGDPRRTAGASLIEEVLYIDQELERAAGGPGSVVGSGGMASKLAAAKIATWSGVEVVIADAARPGVLRDAVHGKAGVGTRFRPDRRRLPARKLWIAFAVGASGTVVVDDGARRALTERGTSLLLAGVRDASGSFSVDDAVEIAGEDGAVFAKGLTRSSREQVVAWAGRRSDELPDGVAAEVVHRDDLVILR
ncbi:MAG: glutamate 5-kinase [Actinomycetota bacterium]|nr:glutamate 5-kinase [Actinomycetota bacterium]